MNAIPLASMGFALDNIDSGLVGLYYYTNTNDLFYNPTTKKLYFVVVGLWHASPSTVEQLVEVPINPQALYIHKITNRVYQWQPTTEKMG